MLGLPGLSRPIQELTQSSGLAAADSNSLINGQQFSRPFCLTGPIQCMSRVILHNSCHSHFMDKVVAIQQGEQLAQDAQLMSGRAVM